MTCLRRSWAELPSLPRSMPPRPQLALYPPTSLEPLASNYFKCIFHYHGSAAWLPFVFFVSCQYSLFCCSAVEPPTRFNPLLGPDDVFRANRSSGKAETTFREVITIFRTRRDCSRARTFRFFVSKCMSGPPWQNPGPGPTKTCSLFSFVLVLQRVGTCEFCWTGPRNNFRPAFGSRSQSHAAAQKWWL